MKINDTNGAEKGGWTVRGPVSAGEWDRLWDLRWRVLRAPWGQPRGSERDALDDVAVQRIAVAAGGRVVGVGRLQLNSAEEGQVRYMAVEESMRSRGIGGALLEALEAEARRLGVRRIVLEARQEAVPFYLRHGYRVVAAGKTLFGSVAHAAMAKDLGTGAENESPRPA